MDRKRGARALASVSVLGLVLLLGPTRAGAYRIINTPHELDPTEQELDHNPPGAVDVLEVRVHRGQGSERVGCAGWAWIEDQGVGHVSIRVAPPADDRTPAESLGYRVELVSGQAPEGLLPGFDIRAYVGADGVWLFLDWSDGETDEQEPLDFELRLRAVDLGGNLGEAAQPIVVNDPGSGGGCATGASSLTGLAGFLALLLCLLACRHRSR